MQPAERRRRASYADVLRAPEHMVAEIIAGELYLSPRPAGPATAVASSLGGELYAPFGRGRGGPGGWMILDEPEVHAGEEIFVPELGGWRRERLSAVPDGAFFTVIPDWICEVLSPSTARLDRAELPLYATLGVRHVWLVEPRRRFLEVFELVSGRWVTVAVHKDDQRVRLAPFEALELDLALLWADVPAVLRAREEPGHYAFEGY